MNKLSFLRPTPLRGKIRLGDKADGGYVIYERMLAETDVLLTYGVGDNISFEEHFNQLTGKKVYMFDPTMFGKYLVRGRMIAWALPRLHLGAICRHLLRARRFWLKKKQLESRNILFINEGIAVTRSDKYDTLGSHLQRLQLTGSNVLLKIDIEGEEYKVFGQKDIYDGLAGVNQLILEVHNLKQQLRQLESIVTELGKQFTLAHIHPNNYSPCFMLYDLAGDGKNDLAFPDVLELLWVRTTRIREEDVLREDIRYPVADLDYPNNPQVPDHVVNFF